jgi:hypothetical protein
MKFTTLASGSLFIMCFLAGCSTTLAVCPQYPKPSAHVLESLKSLNDSEVDQWLTKQYKLNKQLGVCNGL